MSTRRKITKEAIRLFNIKGFRAVSLNELASSLNMSRGNLTYHFPNKVALLEAISTQMWTKASKSQLKSRKLPSFENLHDEVQRYYKLQKEYAFIFLDRHMLNHPVLKKEFREMTSQTIINNEAAIAFAIELGNMKPENIKGTYKNIAFITWMLTFFWLSQQIIRGERTSEDGEKMIWSILLPHLTKKGVISFHKFFGVDYFENLGPPFDIDLEKLINF
ncbi:MAG: TetR/AcrR family transcriptional regulator [Saprospiraceae bacterium]